MDSTNRLVPLKFNVGSNKEDSQTYFKTLYPEAVYIPEDDEYEYRGIRFNYFKSGIPFGGVGIGSYMLIDKDINGLWLYTYGDKEDRWNDYIIQKRPAEKSFFYRFLDWLL